MAYLDDEIIMAVASSYDRKYYFNPEFSALPEAIQAEIQILLVSFTMEIGGVLSLGFSEEGTMFLSTECDEEDILYDEIGAHLKIKQMRATEADLFESLETFFRVFYLGEEA